MLYLVFQSKEEQETFNKIFDDVPENNIRFTFDVKELTKKYLADRQRDLATQMSRVHNSGSDIARNSHWVLFGAALASAYFGQRTPLTKNRKKLFRNHGVKTSFTFSPGIDPTLLNEIASDLRWASQDIQNPMTDMSRVRVMNLPDLEGAVCLDVETVGKAWDDDSYIRCAAMCADKHVVYGTPSEQEVNAWLYDFIKKSKCGMGTMLIGHNNKSDLLRVYRQLPKLRNLFMFPDLCDTWVASTMLDENAIGQSLKQVCAKYLGVETWGQGIDLEHCEKEDYDKLVDYCMTDASMNYLVAPVLLGELHKEGLYPLFRHVMKAEREIVEMELNGLKVDREQIKPIRKQVLKDMVVLTQRMDRIAPEVNVDSNNQLSELLYEKFQLPVLVKTDSGAGSVGADALTALLDSEELAGRGEAYEYIHALCEYKKVKKLWDGYIHTLENYIASDGRIHTTFVIGKDDDNGTVTGRLSSKEPNLQNPLRGKTVRGLFIPEKGNVLIAADYSQIELRILAHFANDPVMIDAFKHGQDLHTATLAAIKGVDYEEALALVKKGTWEEPRSLTKQINFGIPYGVGPSRLMQLGRKIGIKLTYKAAQKMLDEWLQRFPGVTGYIDATHAQAISMEFVTDLFGRKRRLMGASKDSAYGLGLLRQATNQRIQSSAADMCLIAMGVMGELIREELMRGEIKMVHQLHDSIMCEVRADKTREAQEIMEASMVSELEHVMNRDFGIKLRVPLKVDFKVYTERWG
jgi:DNA polymerase-1